MSGSDPFTAAIDRLAGHFGRVYDRFDEIDARLDAQGKQLDAQGKQLDAQGKQLDAQGKQLDAQGKQLNALTDDVIRTRAELMARLDRQQDLLTLMKDDMQVNIAAADTTREELRVFRNQQHDLTHQVSIIHRRLLQLEQRLDKGPGA